MSCERYGKALAGLAAGAPLSAEQADHLAACAACRAELASLRAGLTLADATLHEIVSYQPSPQLAVRIARAVAEAESGEGPRRRPWFWAWAAAAACLPLLAALAWNRERLSAAPIVAPASMLAVAPAPSQSTPPEDGSQSLSPRAARPESPRGRTRGGRAGQREPLILVPSGQAEALEELAAELQARAVDPGALPVSDPERDLPEPKPIEIEPLTLAPLDEGERS